MRRKRLRTSFAVSDSAISLPKNEEVLIFNYTGYGELSFLSTAISTKSHNVRLEIDGEDVFDIDFSILSDVMQYDKNTTNTIFTTEIKSGEYVFTFSPREKLEYHDSCKVFATNYGNGNKDLDNAILMRYEEERNA